MKLSPKHCRALKLLGSALYAQGDFENACSALQSALHLNPKYADAYCDLGCALCALGRVEPAKEAFGNAARLDSNHVEVSYACMLLVAVCCSHVEALVIGGLLNQAPSPIMGVETHCAHIWLRRNHRATPSSSPTCISDKHVLCTGWVLQALFNLGNLHRQSSEYRAAVQSYDAVLALDSRHWRSMLNKAVALMGLHEDEAAVSALKLAYTTSGKICNRV